MAYSNKSNSSISFKLAVKRNTEYADSTQLRALEHYIQMKPCPYTSGDMKLRTLSGLGELVNLSKGEILQYVHGFLKTYCMNYTKVQKMDIMEEFVKNKDYAMENDNLYKSSTFKNKVSNLISGLNRYIQKIAEEWQISSGCNPNNVPDHWRKPIYINLSRDPEAIVVKRVLFMFYMFYTFYTLYIYILYVFITSANHSVL